MGVPPNLGLTQFKTGFFGHAKFLPLNGLFGHNNFGWGGHFSAPNGLTPKRKFTRHPRREKNTLVWCTKVGSWQLACLICPWLQIAKHADHAQERTKFGGKLLYKVCNNF